MGGCNTKMTEDQKVAMRLNAAIAKQNAEVFKSEQEKIKILLLGAGESGKSTIFKQMKILYGKGFSDKDRVAIRQTIYGNLILGAQALISGAKELGMRITCEAEVETISKMTDEDLLTPDLIPVFETFWNNEGTMEAFAQRSKFQLHESVEKYFQDIERICAGPGIYTPSIEDVLLCRVRTSGVIVENYEIDRVQFEMYDVGGQRNERKKWIHCFDNVTTLIFVAALSDYDLMMYEDNTKLRMEDAIDLFAEMSNSPYFKNTSMILFLNKRDLFERKLKSVDLGLYYPEFTMGICKCGGGYPSKDECKCLVQPIAKQYLKQKFEEKAPAGKKIFTHITCATDTGNVKAVFDACKEIILKNNIKGSGLDGEETTGV